MDNIEAQNEELLALESIYDSKCFIIENREPPSGCYVANVNLNLPFYVVSRCESITDHSNEDLGKEKFEIQYLPPLSLYFQFPNTYPSHTSPSFLLACNWLSLEQLSKLCQKLESIWINGGGEVVLFDWIQFLQEETLIFLNISNELDITELTKYNINNLNVNYMEENSLGNLTADVESTETNKLKLDKLKPALSKSQPNDFKKINRNVKRNLYRGCITPSTTGGNGYIDNRAILDLPNGKLLKVILKDYNKFKNMENFKETWHVCNICFLEKKGIEFARFVECNHAYCKDCLQSYFEIQIKAGNVNYLNCPEKDCMSKADSALIKELVNNELFEKYDALLLSRTLESMPDVAYCPRNACQCPLIIDSCGRMGNCPSCHFVFCPYCKMAYHGVQPCNFKSKEKEMIFIAYFNGDNDKRLELEKRYGKRALHSLIEDRLSEKWLTSNSKNCPQCNASIEKNEGCNKMTCYRCGSHFCWLCLSKLKTSNPYLHYNDPSSPCFDQLFPDEYFNNFDDDIEPGEFL